LTSQWLKITQSFRLKQCYKDGKVEYQSFSNKELDLPLLQKSLDNQSLEIIESQKNGVASIKQLIDSTKQFKKLPDQDKLDRFKDIIKGTLKSQL
jgi:hypothetical protein